MRLRQRRLQHQSLVAGGKRLLQKADGYRFTIKTGEVTFENGEHVGGLEFCRAAKRGRHRVHPHDWHGAAAVTLYRVGVVKQTAHDAIRYVNVDGGMMSPRWTLSSV